MLPILDSDRKIATWMDNREYSLGLCYQGKIRGYKKEEFL